jgi:uncharacterized protein YunC (DUF1805 family)
MINTENIKIKCKTVQGIEIPLKNATLVLVNARKGYIMCGYLNLEVAEKFKDAACIVRGVKNIDELINSTIASVTSQAKKLGIKPGMPAKKALEKLV